MKKKLFAFLGVAVMLMGTLTGCGETKETKKEPEEIVHIDESEIDAMFTNPDKFAGKYVKLVGQLIDAPQKEEDTTALQLYYDIDNYTQTYIVYTANADGISNQDYVYVDGKIDGKFSGENYFGSAVECPLIVDATVTKGSYLDIVTPTIAEITPAVSQDQNGVIVSVDKVEYAKNETRVYVTINNTTDYNYSCGTYGAKLLVNGNQVDQSSDSMTIYNCSELTELSYDVMAGVSASGVLIYPAIEQNVPFQFILPDSYSDNYDLMFTNYMIDVPVE